MYVVKKIKEGLDEKKVYVGWTGKQRAPFKLRPKG